MEIAIIAHDGKKADMVQFINKNKDLLQKENIKLIATGTTGGKVEAVGIKVKRMLSGPMGGDAQIAARVAEGKTKNEAMRCLKRYIAREIFHALRPPQQPAKIVA